MDYNIKQKAASPKLSLREVAQPAQTPPVVQGSAQSPKTPRGTSPVVQMPPAEPKPKTNTFDSKYSKIVYTQSLIDEKLSGYVRVISQLWEHLPLKCHIRYFKRGEGTHIDRFKSGGFLKAVIRGANGVESLVLENKINGNGRGYISFSIKVETIDELWKKYAYDAYIEIHMMSASLAQKKVQIEELSKRLAILENKLK